MRFFKLIVCCFFLSLLSGCKEDSSTLQHVQKFVVKSEPLNKTLAFTGTIQPLKENTLSSSMDAIIETMNFHYGQLVHKGDVVIVLNSSELQKQYNDILTDYLKAKDSYNVAKAKFTGTQELWDAGLLSKNNYLSEKSSLDTARITLMQSTRKLSEMLEKMDDGADLSSLSLAEFDKVRQALSTNHNLIRIKAPATGILLYPPKSGDDKSGRLSVGSAVKSGQAIGLIGDMSGISVEIDVPEVDIDKIHPGMKASVSGVALGQEVLHGELVAVNAQATANGGALPSFSAIVEVKHLSKKQQALIKVGMSASIELVVDEEKQLLIPIAAVSRENGRSVVQLHKPDGVISKQPIATGATQMDKVSVIAGLKEGDVIVYD
ncbi:membrane-fusion protein AcrA [Legionella quinlivanii]|uniref:Membrane-fusion protein AcrA n=1 Tax=Legionella quinlivanii TaxID=45073 RepID=A0A0W0Y556_9GAMM|nr:efflux RND transporter periplasmic adaptor subunit [Legionella quinlivanii]KTD52072.1 membrane-fusion protein AcrA [Legionella quinlivanii]MCW8452336.1 efflux RND transporter periplasmic adaptor subunit [Legionella quinlivanii]SEF89276.1 Multidrug efflux pump subunit AcrA (membrane-fusion protein) [Legionella quinlivanii DSM 21216]STY12432.1 Membrane-fusion protein [Legionella quinlivanii]